MRCILIEKITIPVFDQQTICFNNAKLPDTLEDGITYSAGGGTLILKKVKLPESAKNRSIFVEVAQYSDGDAYDRTGSVFVIPTGKKQSFLDAIRNLKSVPSFQAKDGNYPAESQVPVYTSSDVTASYAIKLRLKGELTLTGDEWMIDYIYAQLAGLFQPYPPTSFPEVFMCKGGEQSYATFDSFRRTWTFDITYDRSNLSFSQLYFNLFVNAPSSFCLL